MHVKLKINIEVSKSPFSRSQSEIDPLEIQIAIAVFNQKSLLRVIFDPKLYSLKIKNISKSYTKIKQADLFIMCLSHNVIHSDVGN